MVHLTREESEENLQDSVFIPPFSICKAAPKETAETSLLPTPQEKINSMEKSGGFTVQPMLSGSASFASASYTAVNTYELQHNDKPLFLSACPPTPSFNGPFTKSFLQPTKKPNCYTGTSHHSTNPNNKIPGKLTLSHQPFHSNRYGMLRPK